MHALTSKDRLALVVYSTQARVVHGLLKMDEAGRQRANTLLDGLVPGGSTNLWDGLQTGLTLLEEAKADGGARERMASVVLLTDGRPNVKPPRGHQGELRHYKEVHEGVPGSINTFGFGYNLDSTLLKDLAIAGDGAYGFIPDATLVGTVFVHCLANLLTTMVHDLRLSLQPRNGAELCPTAADGSPAAVPGMVGGLPAEQASWGLSVNLGAVRYGQSRDVVVRLRLPPGVANDADILAASTSYHAIGPAAFAPETDLSAELKVGDVLPSGAAAGARLSAERLRCEAVDAIRTAMAHVDRGVQTRRADETDAGLKLAQAAIAGVVARVGAAAEAAVLSKPLLEDLQGQVTEALSRADWYKRWGQHYLYSLMGAHLAQQANNFKDPGVQHYGGPLFAELRDEADAIFSDLPPPKPTAKPVYNVMAMRSGHGSSGSSAACQPRAVRSMASYNSRDIPCFAAHSPVAMADGSTKPVGQLRRGDVVRVPVPAATAAQQQQQQAEYEQATVRCVVETLCPDGHTDLVTFAGGLAITPYHPVRVGGRWHFPGDLAAPERKPCPSVFSFVLDRGHVMDIGGVACVTLGHDFAAPVVSHPYFGSPRVVADLAALPGWQQGKVRMLPGAMGRRNADTGLVDGIFPSRVLEAEADEVETTPAALPALQALAVNA